MFNSLDNLWEAPTPSEIMLNRSPARREKIRLLLNIFSNVVSG
jgi:hypothetical protein